MSRSCRSCGRPYRSGHRHGGRSYGRRHRTVFSQGGFWTAVLLVLALIWLWSAATGRA